MGPFQNAGRVYTDLALQKPILDCTYHDTMPGAPFFKEECKWHPVLAFIKYTSAPIHPPMQIRVGTEAYTVWFLNNHF